MGLVIQIDQNEWRRLSEVLLERAGESLNETERTAVTAFFDLAEPHVEAAQVEMLRGATNETVEFDWREFTAVGYEQAVFEGF